MTVTGGITGPVIGGVGGAFTPVSPGAVTVIGFKLVPVKVTGVSAGLVEKVPVFEPVSLGAVTVT